MREASVKVHSGRAWEEKLTGSGLNVLSAYQSTPNQGVKVSIFGNVSSPRPDMVFIRPSYPQLGRVWAAVPRRGPYAGTVGTKSQLLYTQ